VRGRGGGTGGESEEGRSGGGNPGEEVRKRLGSGGDGGKSDIGSRKG